MKLSTFAVAATLTLFAESVLSQSSTPVAAAVTASPSVPAPFKTALEATSYAVGADMVRNFKAQDVAFDLTQLIQGINDATSNGKKLLLSDADVKRLVTGLELDVRSKMIAAHKVEADANLKKSAEFLKSNGARPGVVTLASGVQYLPEKTGTGPKPVDDSTVIANFTGTLPDGTIFDASEKGKPVSVKLSQVIPGWREALKLMPAGSKWELTLPPSQAYGERGAGRVVGPNQVLRFDVEVLEVR